MGATIWADTEGRGENEALADNSIMLKLEEALATMADKLGVARLSSFYDQSVLLREYAETLPVDVPERAVWFEPSEVLQSVAAIRSFLQANPEAQEFTPGKSQQHWPHELAAELAHCQRCLKSQ